MAKRAKILKWNKNDGEQTKVATTSRL